MASAATSCTARGGLQTPYLGEWMANIAAGVEEARERGMGAWAYDENGWPSGFGDGRVNGRGERYQQKYSATGGRRPASAWMGAPSRTCAWKMAACFTSTTT